MQMRGGGTNKQTDAHCYADRLHVVPVLTGCPDDCARAAVLSRVLFSSVVRFILSVRTI
uniref:Uncharacterized protein n=1 Tax=Anguilla anguilla TaxID=7936 RepID=A0A0E9UME9_ANGAN